MHQIYPKLAPLFPVNDPLNFDFSSLKFVSSQCDHQVWMSTRTSKSYQVYTIMTPISTTIQKQMELYEWRRMQSDLINRVYYVEQLENSYSFRHLRVFLERTTQLLKRGTREKFSWAEGMQLLKKCLKGYQTLYRKFGLISVSDTTISFTDDNKVKVWINSNFARNTCIYYGDYAKDSVDEQGSMVRSIFSTFEPYIQPNKFLIKLKSIIQSTSSFAQVYSKIDLILAEQRASRSTSTFKTNSCERKYFCKTPQKSPLKVDYKKQQINMMKYSYASASSQQNNSSYKYIPNRPSCLEFRHDAEGGRRDGNRFNTSKDRKYLGGVNKNSSIYLLHSKEKDLSLSPQKKSVLSFNNSGAKTKRHYFGNKKKSTSKFNEMSREKITVKESWSSNDLSFKSQKKMKSEVNQSTLKPSNLLERFRTKKTGSTFNRSPSPATHLFEQRTQSSTFYAPIAKSMTLIKKELEILNNLKSRNYGKESTNDLEASQRTEEVRTRRDTGFTDLHNIIMVEQSIIQNPVDEPVIVNTNAILELKNSMFNKIDDLKESEIVLEINDQYGSNKIGLHSPRFPPKQTKALCKFTSKPLTESIKLERPESEKQITEPVEYVPTALDRFAKFRTESRLHEPMKPSLEVRLRAVSETPEDEV